MAKREEIAREALEQLLLPNEQLLGVGEFTEMLSFGRSFLPPVVNVATQKSYWVGVTDGRVIFIPLGVSGAPIGTENYALAREDVLYKSLILTVVLPNAPKPQKLQPNFGIKKLSGFDDFAFRAAMKRS